MRTSLGGRVLARVGGAGPPLVLVHGFPQTAAMWHRIAPALARRSTLVVPDLRGDGWSSVPPSRDGEGFTKRAMGADIVALMDDLGFARFRFCGHDRGARIGYRRAPDQPGRVERPALLDFVPTIDVWRAREADTAVSPPWPRLARPAPELPARETERHRRPVRLRARGPGASPRLAGVETDTGHFTAEEDPDATLAAPTAFL